MEKRRDRLGHLEAILPADAVVFEQTLQRVVELGSKQGETTPWAITVSTCGQLLKQKDATDVTPISGPVPMRAGGVIRPLSIAGGLPGAYAPGEPSAVCSCCTPSCVALPIPLLPVTMRIAQYSKIHP
jgi:hypothetical protein